MTKILLYIIGGTLIAVVGLAYVSAPEKPRVWPKPADQQKVQLCLKDIPKFYKSFYFTRLGHIAMWVGNKFDEISLPLTPDWGSDLVQYTALKIAVNCYIRAAGSTHLHMAQSPTAFVSNFNSLAKAHNISVTLQ